MCLKLQRCGEGLLKLDRHYYVYAGLEWILHFMYLSIVILQKKLDTMLYIGLTQNHKESANMFANIVGAQVISQRKTSRSSSGGAGNNEIDFNCFYSSVLNNLEYFSFLVFPMKVPLLTSRSIIFP